MTRNSSFGSIRSTINIEKMRADMLASQQRLDFDRRWETRKFVVSAIIAAAAAVGAGLGIGNLIWANRPPPQTIIIQQPR